MTEATDDRATARRSATRSRNPQGEGGRLRDELIAAAGRLIAGGTDPEALSLRAVAREANVAAPSVYLQFENKDALLRSVVVDHFARFRQAIEAGVETGNEPASRLLNGCLAYGRFATDQPGSYRIIFETRQPAWIAPAPGSQVGMDAFQVLVDGVAACINAGVAAPGDPFRIATDIWIALHGMATLRQRLPGFPWPDADEQVARILGAFTGIPDMRPPLQNGVSS